MFVLELDDGAIQLVVGVQSVDQLVPLRVLRPLPVKGILLGVETLDLLQGLVQPGLHGLGLLLVAADLLEVPERLKLLELLLVALQLRLEPIPAELYNTHTVQVCRHGVCPVAQLLEVVVSYIVVGLSVELPCELDYRLRVVCSNPTHYM